MSVDGWGLPLEDRPPTLGDADVERYKWAWNEAEGELVWRVSGPGDGRPYHEEQVRQAWGREPSLARGDILGGATYAPTAGHERALVSIHAYSGPVVPASIARRFEDSFPGADLRLQPRP